MAREWETKLNKATCDTNQMRYNRTYRQQQYNNFFLNKNPKNINEGKKEMQTNTHNIFQSAKESKHQ